VPFRGQAAPEGSGGGGGTNSTAVTTSLCFAATGHGSEFEVDITTMPGSIADASGLIGEVNVAIGGLFVVQVAFDGSYGGGGVRISGYDRVRSAQTEDILASAGNTVKGAKVFSEVTNLTTLTPGGSIGQLARVQFRRVAVIDRAPVTAFVAVYNALSGGLQTITTSDLTNGWVEVAGGVLPAQGSALTVLYTWSHTHTIS
jgi:hypothetical protein